MGKHTRRVLRGILGAIDKEMDQHAGSNGGRRKMERLTKERKYYRRKLEREEGRGGRIH